MKYRLVYKLARNVWTKNDGSHRVTKPKSGMHLKQGERNDWVAWKKGDRYVDYEPISKKTQALLDRDILEPNGVERLTQAFRSPPSKRTASLQFYEQAGGRGARGKGRR